MWHNPVRLTAYRPLLVRKSTMYTYLSRALVVGMSVLHSFGPSEDIARSAGTAAVAEMFVLAGNTETCRRGVCYHPWYAALHKAATLW